MGTYRKEWECCGSVTETEAWEPEHCPFCTDDTALFRKDAEREVAGLRNDAARLDWLRDKLFEHKWNGVVGKGCAVQWQVAGDFRFTQRELTDDSGIAGGDFRRAVDRAMAASK